MVHPDFREFPFSYWLHLCLHPELRHLTFTDWKEFVHDQRVYGECVCVGLDGGVKDSLEASATNCSMIGFKHKPWYAMYIERMNAWNDVVEHFEQYNTIFKHEFVIRLHCRRNEVVKQETNPNICYTLLQADLCYRKLSYFNKQHLHLQPIRNLQELQMHEQQLTVGNIWVNDRIEHHMLIPDVAEKKVFIENDREHVDTNVYEEDEDEVPAM